MFDKKIFLALGVVFLILLLALGIGMYCVGPIILNARAGDMVLACIFPWPWSLLSGIGRQYYYFNFYLCLIVPGIILLVWFFSAVLKSDR
ncbi:MAG: hypothetical protein M1282_18970 [Chloroflexi bacterium]|nr:hypothetical protein [Chloroflexota bacterium]